MKKMTCIQLGGACDKVFHANTFDEMAELSKAHGMEMFQLGDDAHMDALGQLMDIVKTPESMKKWMDQKRKEFDALAEEYS
ncbi:MAG: hypothetical protein ACERKD_12690 [Prolixibacteraceae bacterium]